MTKIERLTATLLLLQEKQLTSQRIARHFEVSRRTVLRDIQALCEMGFPIAAREGVGGGYSLPRTFRIPPLPLTTREAFLLLLAVAGLRDLSDTPYSSERASLVAKLRAILPAADIPRVERLLTGVKIDVPARAQKAPFLDDLVAAIEEKRWIRIDYESAEKASRQTVFPRRIESRGGLWYCHAYSRERREDRVFRVDRVRSLSRARGAHAPPPPTPAYDDPRHPEVRATMTARGVAMSEADRDLAERIQRRGDGSGMLRLRCPPSELPWYARFFAGLGEEVTVQGPPALKKRLADIGKGLAERYG